jgi:hypothetical protein
MSTGARNKRRGAEWEIRLLKYLRKEGFASERLRLAGRDDEGDISIVDPDVGYPVVIEAKAPGAGNPIRLSEWVREASEEAENYRNARLLDDRPLPVVVIKAPNKPVNEAYVVMRLDDFLGVR